MCYGQSTHFVDDMADFPEHFPISGGSSQHFNGVVRWSSSRHPSSNIPQSSLEQNLHLCRCTSYHSKACFSFAICHCLSNKIFLRRFSIIFSSKERNIRTPQILFIFCVFHLRFFSICVLSEIFVFFVSSVFV